MLTKVSCATLGGLCHAVGRFGDRIPPLQSSGGLCHAEVMRSLANPTSLKLRRDEGGLGETIYELLNGK